MSVDCAKGFRNFIQDVLRTFSGLSQDLLRNTSRLSQVFFYEFIWTLSELSQDFLRTFPGLSHSQNFVITSQNSLRSFP